MMVARMRQSAALGAMGYRFAISWFVLLIKDHVWLLSILDK